MATRTRKTTRKPGTKDGAQAVPVGSRIGSFKIIKPLGLGNMGDVYLAEDTVVQRKVALKIMAKNLAADADARRRFEREAQVMGKLIHPNIVAAYSFGIERGCPYFVGEYCEGEGANALLEREGVVPWLRALEIIIQAARGLKCAHDNGVVHRDVKPQNIVLLPDGTAKLLGFFVCRADADQEQDGLVIGTPQYMSPEQARGETQVGARADIYGLGATFYHLVSGQPPFAGASSREEVGKVLEKVQRDEPPSLKSLRPDLPEGVVRVVGRMMAKDPAQRYRDCGELIADLELLRQGLLDMDQAIALLKTTRPTFYRWLRAGKLKGLKVGRQWRFERQAVERFLKGEEPRIELPVDIKPLVEKLRADCIRAGGEQGLPTGTDVAAAVDLMILLAHRGGASDLHLEPVLGEAGGAKTAQLRLRVDGSLRKAADIDARLLPALIERWKALGACNVNEKERPQQGRITLEIQGPAGKQRLDQLVSFLPTVLGEAVTARLFPAVMPVLTLDKMDFSPADRARLMRALGLPYGLLVFAGPVGSGKSTVLYSCACHLTKPEHKLFSLEDPIHYYLPGVQQVQLKPAVGLDFKAAMKALMCSDPDIVMVGELHDRETFRPTLDAALSGHLVMAVMHADEAVRVLQQLVEQTGEPFHVCDAVKFVSAQRLVRKLCKECSVEKTPSPELLAKAVEVARAGGLAWEALPSPQHFREPVGCAKCSTTGHRGRTMILETLEMTPALAAGLRRGASLDELRAVAIQQGMTTMAADGIRKAALGVTSLMEVLRTCGQA